MQKVYANTTFNISADHSENSHGGCFIDRLAYKIMPCPYTAPTIGQLFLVPRFGLTRPLTESPIANRAWVIQERYLSPRILHFTAEQMFWECAGLYACETFPKGMPSVYNNSARRHAHEISNDVSKTYMLWGRICEDYSRAALTYTSDRIIAFAGIVAAYQSRLPHDTYLAGMWKSDLVNGLLWKAMGWDDWVIQPSGSRILYADPYITASLPEKYRAPSWSWLGKDCSIFWQNKTRYHPKTLVTVLDVIIELVDKNKPAGDILTGSITLKGRLRAAQWEKIDLEDCIILDGKSGAQLQTPSTDPSSPTPKVTLQRDTGAEFPTKDIYCLLVRMSVPPGGISIMMEGLVLGPAEKENEYQRLGHFEAIGEGPCRALFYELTPLARELEQPWRSLTPGLEVEVRRDGDGLGGMYDDDWFREVEEREIRVI
jgi:hypothetical protein